MTALWERKQWAALVGVLALIIVLMAMAWPHSDAPAYDHIVVRVVDGPTVLSTQIVPIK